MPNALPVGLLAEWRKQRLDYLGQWTATYARYQAGELNAALPPRGGLALIESEQELIMFWKLGTIIWTEGKDA